MATHVSCWQGWGSGHGQLCPYKLDIAPVRLGEQEVPYELSLIRSYPGWHKPCHPEHSCKGGLEDAAGVAVDCTYTSSHLPSGSNLGFHCLRKAY